ncbi:MAG: T9SS type A sorting domain-containing protein [Bacteroidales bacterium]|nr:T9SS type A sorting domain-containing protein [Bacteroidales bacterium]
MKKTFLLFAALLVGATSANAQRFISTDAIATKDKNVVKETLVKPSKQQVTNAAKSFVYGNPVVSVSFDDPSQYAMENLLGHTAGTGAGMFHRFDTSAASSAQLASTFPRFYSFFRIADNGFYHVARYMGYENFEIGNLIGDGFALVSPYDIFYAEGTNTKAFNTVVRITEPIETTGFNTVDVVFNQYTQRFNEDRYFIDYSTDANFATYDSLEFNVKGLELTSNEMTRGQKIVTLPVASTVDQTALYIRLRYKCNLLSYTDQPSGYRWMFDEVRVYDGPEYRINVISTNHNDAAYGVVPAGMAMDTMQFLAVVENTGGNSLFSAVAEERYHNATDYVFPNDFGSFLDHVNVSATPQTLTTVVRIDTTFDSNTGAITAIDNRRHVEIEARTARPYNQNPGLYGISSGVKYLETATGTDYNTLPMADSLYYRVSEMPGLAELGTARWASDVDVLIEGRAWAYGIEGGYISSEAPGSAVAGYEVCNRFMTPSDLPLNTYFAKGVEVVPAADSCDAGLSIQVSLKYMDFNPETVDGFVLPYLMNNEPVLSNVVEVEAANLNNGIFTNPDRTEYTTVYNSIYVPFTQSNVVLEPDNWYFACYKLLDDGRFLVARDDKDYMPTFRQADQWTQTVMTPGEESEGYAWGYVFGDWLSKNSQPMIRLMVSKNPVQPASINSINNVAAFNLNAYPNPAQNETTIEYTLNTNSNVVITVSDIMGREIVRFNEGVKAANTISRVALNTANMNNGTYFYTINANGIKETKKLVINK